MPVADPPILSYSKIKDKSWHTHV